MAHIHRLILVLLLLIAAPAFAADKWYIPSGIQPPRGYRTLEAACQAHVRAMNDADAGTAYSSTLGSSSENASTFSCTVMRKGPWDTVPFGRGGDIQQNCPQGVTCVEEEEPPPTADEACGMHSYIWNAWSRPETRQGIVESSENLPLDKPTQVCMPMSPEDFGGSGGPNAPPGCKHEFTPQLRYRMTETDPWRYEGDSWAMNGPGTACVPGLDDAPGDPNIPRRDDPKPGCEGGIPGNVNGVDVCLDPASGRTEGVDWTQVTDAEGRTREIKHEIKCEGEKCVVTTTNKIPGSNEPGNVTTTETTRGQYCAKNPESSVCQGAVDPTGSTRNQNGRGGNGRGNGSGNGNGDGEGDGFCKENPNSPMCKESSFGGSCQANFQCEGDAIQCAIAREQHIRNCKLFDDASDESRLYDQHKGKEGNQTNELPGNETIPVGGSFDMSSAIGGGSCIADRSVTVWGVAVTLPFSAICPSLAAFGNLLVAVSLLLALRIVGRG